jgi:hypothetical protein
MRIAVFSDIHANPYALRAALDGVRAGIVAHGHFHYPFHRSVRGLCLIDVASVGGSVFVSAPCARYTVFTYRDGWKVERRCVEYDFRRETRAILNSDMPGKASAAALYGG